MGLNAVASAAEVARSYLGAFATGDPDAVAAWVTEDFVNEHTAALGSGCLPGFLGSMPGLRYDVEDVIAEGEKVAAAYTLRTTVNERPIAVRGVMRFEIRDGLIARRIDYWDSLVFKQQAGLE
jgi:ketosteroid isomerase-like protein